MAYKGRPRKTETVRSKPIVTVTNISPADPVPETPESKIMEILSEHSEEMQNNIVGNILSAITAKRYEEMNAARMETDRISTAYDVLQKTIDSRGPLSDRIAMPTGNPSSKH